MNNTRDKQGPKLTFWHFLFGFAMLEVAIAALAAIGSGCASVDPDAAYCIYTNIVIHVKDSGTGASSKGSDEASSGVPESASSSFSAEWRYGGFNGGKAAEDPSCQIAGISMSSKGVTFNLSGAWWGATHDNPTMRCCAFYKDGGGKWVGGFWEWGSPDRKYRAFTNIDGGYKNWDAKAFHAAKEYAFCICSKDGKKRSNIVYSR